MAFRFRPFLDRCVSFLVQKKNVGFSVLVFFSVCGCCSISCSVLAKILSGFRICYSMRYFSGFSSEYAPHPSQPFARLLGMRDSRDRSQNMTPKGL